MIVEAITNLHDNELEEGDASSPSTFEKLPSGLFVF